MGKTKAEKKNIIIKKIECFYDILEKIRKSSGIGLHGLNCSNTESDLWQEFDLSKIQNSEDEIVRIISSNTLTEDDKAKILSACEKSFKEQSNCVKILLKATSKMNKKSQADNLDEDWIAYFFDKVRTANSEDLQDIYATILASATKNPKVCSKLFLHIMSVIDLEQLKTFELLTTFCFSEMRTEGNYNGIVSHPIIFFSKNILPYSSRGLHRSALAELSRLGLIEINFDHEYSFYKNPVNLTYGKRTLTIYSPHPVKSGNLLLTKEGYLLYQMVSKNFDTKILDFTMELWRMRGCSIDIYTDGKLAHYEPLDKNN